jgi:hypothetical protein
MSNIDILEQINDVVAEHDLTTAALAQSYFDEAMTSVRDLIDNGLHTTGPTSSYCPSLGLDNEQFDDNNPSQFAARRLVNVHPPERCAGRACVVHAPTQHHMSSWTLLWRSDRGIFERICVCGIGHPDPDQFEFWSAAGLMFNAVHGCDGCCRS